MGCEYSVYLSFNIYAYVYMLMYTYIYGAGKKFAIRPDDRMDAGYTWTLAIHSCEIRSENLHIDMKCILYFTST